MFCRNALASNVRVQSTWRHRCRFRASSIQPAGAYERKPLLLEYALIGSTSQSVHYSVVRYTRGFLRVNDNLRHSTWSSRHIQRRPNKFGYALGQFPNCSQVRSWVILELQASGCESSAGGLGLCSRYPAYSSLSELGSI